MRIHNISLGNLLPLINSENGLTKRHQSKRSIQSANSRDNSMGTQSKSTFLFLIGRSLIKQFDSNAPLIHIRSKQKQGNITAAYPTPMQSISSLGNFGPSNSKITK